MSLRTPHRTVIFCAKEHLEAANAALEAEGFGPDNFNVELEDGRFMFSAALQDWELERITSVLTDLIESKHDYANDAQNPKEKITDALDKESAVIKPKEIIIDTDVEDEKQ